MKFFWFISLFYTAIPLWTQECSLVLSAQVLDKATGIPLGFATLYLEEDDRLMLTDSIGFVLIEGVCPGEAHLKIRHLACEAQDVFIRLQKDTSIIIYMEHHAELLDEVMIHGHREESNTTFSKAVTNRDIQAGAHKSLAELASSVAGVSVLRNGATSTKPVVHGLYGNRLAILNNGLAQSGQRWGNDHAPEIDPFAADHISVIKGAASLAYMGTNLGALILVDPGSITDDPHTQGLVNYIFNSNGLAHTLNLELEQNPEFIAWRFKGSMRHSGDLKTPDYYLRNTGRREKNFSLELVKNHRENWNSSLYLSSYNAELGILRGSHISNLTDLEQAIGRDVPFFTTESFSDSINAPRQSVNHHLFKASSKYFFDNDRFLDIMYGLQLNLRKEYDIRRSGRSDTPALSLKQFTHQLGLVYEDRLASSWVIKTGAQFQFVDNINLPGTGILPLIPNYRAYQPALFGLVQKDAQGFSYEAGIRYDYKRYEVQTISASLPRMVIPEERSFHNIGLSAGLKKRWSPELKGAINGGFVMRAPEINELFSMGLHQGVSGIEEGNPDLNVEKSIKFVANLDWFFHEKLFIQALGYYQHVQDYMYLQPEEEFRLTIRGAFPVFGYRQTDVRIHGLDFLLSYEIVPRLKARFKYAMIRVQNIDSGSALVNTPPDNISFDFRYETGIKARRPMFFFQLGSNYVLRQSRVDSSLDFLDAPPAYLLLNFNCGTTVPINDNSLELEFFGDNILNAQYRDYMNRLRYYADEPGINLGLRLKFKWGS